jgi:hypothetical protein
LIVKFDSSVEVSLANTWIRACGNLIAQIRHNLAQSSRIENYHLCYLNQICAGKICTMHDMQIVSMWYHSGIPVRLLTFGEKIHLNCYLKKLN